MNLQPILTKLNTIFKNLESNNNFIGQVKIGLVDIKQKLAQVVSTRQQFQGELEKNKQQIDSLTKQIATNQATFEKAQQQIAALQRNNQATTQQLQSAENKANTANARAQQAEQQIATIQRENQGLQQSIQGLDQQIEQIRTVVETQTRLLDPNNAAEDQNLVGHINGINSILNSILQSGSSGSSGSSSLNPTSLRFIPSDNRHPLNSIATPFIPSPSGSSFNPGAPRVGGKKRRAKKTKGGKKRVSKSMRKRSRRRIR